MNHACLIYQTATGRVVKGKVRTNLIDIPCEVESGYDIMAVAPNHPALMRPSQYTVIDGVVTHTPPPPPESTDWNPLNRSFLGLVDTPDSYVGHAGKRVVVNDTEDGLEFGAITVGGDGPDIPSGLIVMWYGLLANIPAGWFLCDGQNGTPDLRGMFLKGAADGQEAGDSGGNLTHTHTDHTDIINHTHTTQVTDPGHTHTQNAHNHTQDAHNHLQVAHTHTIPVGATDDTSAPFDRADAGTNTSGANATTATGSTTGTNQAATATNQAATAVNQSNTTGITVATQAPVGGVAALTHSTANHEPPYKTVLFIMKA